MPTAYVLNATTGKFDLITTLPLTTRGDLLYQDASGLQRLAKGTSGQFLTIGANDPAWSAVPNTQFSLVAGGAAGLNPANATTYLFGNQPGTNPGTGNSAYQPLIGKTCTLRAAGGIATVAGTKDTAANNVTWRVNVNNGTLVGSTTNTFQAAQNSWSITGLSTALALNDQLQLQFLTPTFTTPPTAVFFACWIYVDCP